MSMFTEQLQAAEKFQKIITCLWKIHGQNVGLFLFVKLRSFTIPLQLGDQSHCKLQMLMILVHEQNRPKCVCTSFHQTMKKNLNSNKIHNSFANNLETEKSATFIGQSSVNSTCSNDKPSGLTHLKAMYDGKSFRKVTWVKKNRWKMAS